jgi:hypothetical protein
MSASSGVRPKASGDAGPETVPSRPPATGSGVETKRWMRRRRRVVRARLEAVSIHAAVNAGALVGLALGLVFGAIAGALVAWFCGAVLDWQRQLSFTLGVTETLLPFGDQVSTLRALSQNWFLVIPAASLIGAALTAILSGLVGGLVAAVYNRTARQARVLVETGSPDGDRPPTQRPPTRRRPAAGRGAATGGAQAAGGAPAAGGKPEPPESQKPPGSPRPRGSARPRGSVKPRRSGSDAP